MGVQVQVTEEEKSVKIGVHHQLFPPLFLPTIRIMSIKFCSLNLCLSLPGFL
jgi:hypothetical protein